MEKVWDFEGECCYPFLKLQKRKQRIMIFLLRKKLYFSYV